MAVQGMSRHPCPMPGCGFSLEASPSWNGPETATQVIRDDGWFIWNGRLVCGKHEGEDGPGPDATSDAVSRQEIVEARRAEFLAAVRSAMGHTRTHAEDGLDHCEECSAAVGDLVQWPCPTVSRYG